MTGPRGLRRSGWSAMAWSTSRPYYSGRRFAIERFAEAYATLEAGDSVGKLLLVHDAPGSE